MKEEPWFGQNLREAFKVIKGMFKKEVKLFNCPFCSYDLKITETMSKGAIMLDVIIVNVEGLWVKIIQKR